MLTAPVVGFDDGKQVGFTEAACHVDLDDGVAGRIDDDHDQSGFQRRRCSVSKRKCRKLSSGLYISDCRSQLRLTFGLDPIRRLGFSRAGCFNSQKSQ
ncbi:hypothetical protein PHSY_002827 [Pseudozyma hubeiensis SY62]|uniref:Uncharacterized protein n=1 Tax=Pseudozyma hubeiensis (strain SY62) TaxID=1305764 RepID=R9P233_PSEHS|nr:hypothetical protein PHSY_002827 [Pseudozyma hubeiensis SY62]GAC95252.1 hypothetical protein PHSY_002827 [Pseudozyma hubeiensis SY62]